MSAMTRDVSKPGTMTVGSASVACHPVAKRSAAGTYQVSSIRRGVGRITEKRETIQEEVDGANRVIGGEGKSRTASLSSSDMMSVRVQLPARGELRSEGEIARASDCLSGVKTHRPIRRREVIAGVLPHIPRRKSDRPGPRKTNDLRLTDSFAARRCC